MRTLVLMSRRVMVALAALLAAAGCRVDPKQEVAQYRNILDARVPPTTAPSASEPLTLQRAMALANVNNERLGLSGEEYVQALINKNRAVAAFLPTLGFQPSFTIGQRPSGTTTPGGPPVSGISSGYRTRGDTVQALEAPVVGNINVFRGFGDVAGLRAAVATIAQSRELLLDLQDTILLNVAQTYYQVLRSEASVAVLRHSVVLQEARLADITQQLQNGLATRLAVAQTRAQLDATRVTLVQAQADVVNGRNVLALLIGLSSVQNPLQDTKVVPGELASEHEYEQLAMQTRHDLQAAREALQAARHNVDAAIAQYYPSVSLNASGFLYREYYSDASKWNAILAVNLPIFSAGVIEADVRTAWSRLRQAALSESAVRRQALNDVQVAYENLMATQQRIAGLEDEVQAADEAYTQSVDALRNGLGTNLDTIAAQDQLLQSQLNLSSARFDRTVFYLDVLRAAGLLTGVSTIPAGPTTAPSSPLSSSACTTNPPPGVWGRRL